MASAASGRPSEHSRTFDSSGALFCWFVFHGIRYRCQGARTDLLNKRLVITSYLLFPHSQGSLRGLRSHRHPTEADGWRGVTTWGRALQPNLLAHNDFRNPLISQGGTHDIVNNVIYNWGVLPGEISDYDSNTFLNFIGNYFIPGPSTQRGPYEILFPEGNPRIYVQGNLGPHRPDPNMDEWALVGFGWGEEGVAPEKYRSFTKFATAPITTDSAAESLDKVPAGAGATAPQRDAIDRRVVNDVKKGSGSIIDSPDEVGGYPKLASGSPPIDSDNDGMADDWELEMGLDPGEASDGNGDLDGDGYTNIEEYLHSLSSIKSA